MCVDGAGKDDRDLFQTYGCWQPFVQWAWQAYGLTDASWTPAGLQDACNINLPFAKVLNSAFLINYGLSDNRYMQWHSSEDYSSLSRADANRFHAAFQLRFIQAGAKPHHGASTHTQGPRRTDLHCLLFNAKTTTAYVTNRASVMLHEGWHHWHLKHNYDGVHPQCSQGNQCDYYYSHTIRTYPFGTLDRHNTDPAHFLFHSPRQVEVEFLADVAEMCRPWMPNSVRGTARMHGNTRLDNEFVNDVPWRIGDPRPW